MKSTFTIIGGIAAFALLFIAFGISSPRPVEPVPLTVEEFAKLQEELRKATQQITSLEYSFKLSEQQRTMALIEVEELTTKYSSLLAQSQAKPVASVSAALPVSGAACANGSCQGLLDNSTPKYELVEPKDQPWGNRPRILFRGRRR